MGLEQKKTLIVVNPRAREGRTGKHWSTLQKEVVEVLKGVPLRVEQTTASDFGSGIVRNALKQGVSQIIVVGGDGTLSHAVQGFFDAGSEAVLALLPAGRGNDFFKSLVSKKIHGSSEAWHEGVRLLTTGQILPTDVGVVEMTAYNNSCLRRLFINIASFGYPGLVVKRVQGREGWIGRSWIGKSSLTYPVQSAASIFDYQPIPMRVSADGQKIYEGPVFSGFVMNGRYNGGGLCWSEDARLDDGLFHLWLSEPQSILTTLKNSSRMKNGRWQGVPGVHLTSAREIEIEVLSPGEDRGHPLLEVDGELPEPPGTWKVRFRNLPGAIRMLRS